MKRQVIAISPIRNEEWILDPFIQSVLTWADRLIIGDHFSTDNSQQICMQYANVVVVKALSTLFSERERRQQLLVEARKFGSQNLIVSVDADEILEPALIDLLLSETVKSSPMGTRFDVPFHNLLPGFETYWTGPRAEIAFIDDGENFDDGDVIHFPRLPQSQHSNTVKLSSGVLHLQYVDWAAMKSKQHWYQVWERINLREKSAIDIYRRYHHMDSIATERIQSCKPEWNTHLQQIGISNEQLQLGSREHWWAEEVARLINDHPKKLFRFIDCGTSNPRIVAELSTLDRYARRLFFKFAKQTQVRDRMHDRDLLTFAIYVFDKFFLRLVR